MRMDVLLSFKGRISGNFPAFMPVLLLTTYFAQGRGIRRGHRERLNGRWK